MKIKPIVLCGGSGSRLNLDKNRNLPKQFIDFGGWTFPDSGVAWSLADSNKTLVVTITFADGDAGRTAQDAFHNNVKDTWSYPVANTPWLSTTWGLKPDLSNVYKVTSIKDGEVDLI